MLSVNVTRIFLLILLIPLTVFDFNFWFQIGAISLIIIFEFLVHLEIELLFQYNTRKIRKILTDEEKEMMLNIKSEFTDSSDLDYFKKKLKQLNYNQLRLLLWIHKNSLLFQQKSSDNSSKETWQNIPSLLKQDKLINPLINGDILKEFGLIQRMEGAVFRSHANKLPQFDTIRYNVKHGLPYYTLALLEMFFT